MKYKQFYYNCSPDYVDVALPGFQQELHDVLSFAPIRETQTEINNDLWWLFTDKGYAYDTSPKGVAGLKPISTSCRSYQEIRGSNHRNLCRTTTTIDAHWHCDFAKSFNGRLVQIEAQFAVVEAMFKDFLGFKMAYNERRLALGVEIVIEYPNQYFKHRKGAVAGMAYYSIAEKTLAAIGLNCPILVVGLEC